MNDDTLPGLPAGRPVRRDGLEFDVAGVTEQGPRPENQDAFTADRLEDTGIVAVADGMGGERGGRMAADIALRTLLHAGPIRSLDGARHAARAADRAVAQAAEEDPTGRAGMGCALAFLALSTDGGGSPGWIGAHVGDVRILSRSPDGVLRLETRDHTPAFARWEAGEVALDEIPDTQGANRLQRAVGRGGEADTVWIPLGRGWRYLLISDGVSKAMRLDELEAALAAPSAAEACRIIAEKVRERGPDDNYTAVVVRAGGHAAPAAFAPERGSFNPPAAVTRSRTSPWIPLLTLIALAALGLAGYALWTARQGAAAAVPRAEVARLEARLDSLAVARSTAASADTADPFAPVLPDTAGARLPRNSARP